MQEDRHNGIIVNYAGVSVPYTVDSVGWHEAATIACRYCTLVCGVVVALLMGVKKGIKGLRRLSDGGKIFTLIEQWDEEKD